MDYRVKCSSINNKIKQYVEVLFSKFDKERDGKLHYDAFVAWVHKHPSMLHSFEDTFSYQIWGEKIDPISNRQMLSFKTLEPEVHCWAYYTVDGKKHNVSKRVWIELHNKFLMIFKAREELLPFSTHRRSWV